MKIVCGVLTSFLVQAIAWAAGNGWIVYLQPGHGHDDPNSPAFKRMFLNAVIWKP